MREDYFVNVAMDTAVKAYLECNKCNNNIMYNSFLVVVVRVLSLIYGELDVLNPYYLKNSVAFINNLCKYGLSRENAALFKEDLLNYYNFDLENNKKIIKEKNPYFRIVLKYLVDMFFLKRKNVTINYVEEEMFLDLVYTSHTKDPYRVSFNYLTSDEPDYIEKYYYSVINELDMTKDYGKVISENLNLEALKYMGVDLSSLENMDTKEIETVQRNAYDYFGVDVTSPMRDEYLDQHVKYYRAYGHKFSTGNGYVDILLLMSIIVTSICVIAFFVFSLM